MPAFKQVIELWGLTRTLTRQGIYGHMMVKATHLFSNLDTISSLARTATAAEKKKKHKERVQKIQERQRARGQSPKVFWKSLGNGKYQGGPALRDRATYPQRFCTAMLKAWESSVGGAL